MMAIEIKAVVATFCGLKFSLHLHSKAIDIFFTSATLLRSELRLFEKRKSSVDADDQE